MMTTSTSSLGLKGHDNSPITLSRKDVERIRLNDMNEFTRQYHRERLIQSTKMMIICVLGAIGGSLALAGLGKFACLLLSTLGN